MIDAVIFDIDGVLLDSFDANLKFYQDLMTGCGYPAPTRDQFHPIFPLTMMDAIRALTKSGSETEVKRIWEAGRSRDIEYPVELLKMPPDAEQTIKALSQDYVLGIVTGRIRESVYESSVLANLQQYFRVAISYQDTKHHKPQPEPLLAAAEKLGLQPNQAVYIGDTKTDIEAAHAAGMKIVIYGPDPISDADAHVSSFKQLPGAIKSLQ